MWKLCVTLGSIKRKTANTKQKEHKMDTIKQKKPYGAVSKALFFGVVAGQLLQPLPVQWNAAPIEEAVDMYEMASAYGLDYLSEKAPEGSEDKIIALAEGE